MNENQVFTDEMISQILDLARLNTDSHCESLSSEPSKEYSDAYFFRQIQRWVTAQSGQVEVPGWISVDERLPAKYEDVMVWPHPTDYCMTAELWGENASGRPGWKYGEYQHNQGHENVEITWGPITHWMPLPPPPGASPTTTPASVDDTTYTVDGIVMSPLEYIDYLHGQITYRKIRSKDSPPQPGLVVKGWDNGAVWAGYYDGSTKGASCDWWIPIPT